MGDESDWVDIASNSSMTCGIRTEGGGTLWCFGQIDWITQQVRHLVDAVADDGIVKAVIEGGEVTAAQLRAALLASAQEANRSLVLARRNAQTTAQVYVFRLKAGNVLASRGRVPLSRVAKGSRQHHAHRFFRASVGSH